MTDAHDTTLSAACAPARDAVRVVTLIDHPAVGGGAERVALDLTAGLDAERFRRTLCVSRWAPERLSPVHLARFTEALERSGVRLLGLRRRRTTDLRAWLALLRVLRRERVDVLHAHKFGSNVWGTLLGRLAGVPVVIAHEHTWSYEGQPLRRALDRHLIARFSDAFVAVSREDRRRMIEIEGVPPDRILELRNAIAVPAARPRDGHVRDRLGLASEAKVIGLVAIQRPQKRIDLLVRAAARLRTEFPELRVLLIGDGPVEEATRIKALVAELGLDDVVLTLGVRDDVPDLLAAVDVAVLSSDFEGSPLAVLEYMEAGLPIVATEVGGLPDLLDDGRCGVLVAPGDDAELAAGIRRLLTDRELATRLGAAARHRRRTEFDLDTVVHGVEDIYERLLVRKGRRVMRMEPLDGFAAAHESWDALAESHGGPFARWAFNEAWWRHLGTGELRLLACRRPTGELVAILPLQRIRRGPLRVLRFLGHGPFDELGPVCAPEHRALVLTALRAELERGALDADVLLAERLPVDADLGNALGGQVINRDASPALELEGLTWESFLAARSRNFREQVRRRERALRREHDVTLRLCDDPERLGADMTKLVALHHARWEGASSALAPALEALHRDVAATALREGWLRLWMLEVDGSSVAAWYGFRTGGREWYYQAGRDPAWDRRSVGFVLMNHTIRSAIEDGMSEYRLLRGDEGYKARFATRDDALQTRILGGTPLGRVAASALAGAARRPRTRELVKGLDR